MKRQRRHRILYPFLLKYFILLNNKIFFNMKYIKIFMFSITVFFFKNYIFSLKIIVLICIYLIKESVNLSKQ